MNILITGAAGFIGSHLCQKHISKKDTVFAVDNLITGSRENIKPFLPLKAFHFFPEDVRSFEFSKLPPVDIMYHLASPASPEQYKKYPIETLMTNSLGTYRTLQFFKESKSGCFVLASTSEVYGDPLVHPQPETYWGNVNPIGPRSCYDEGKRFAESLTMTYHRLYKLNTRIARIFNTYGPHMEKNDGRVVSNFVMQALTSRPLTIWGDGSQTRSFCYVTDTIEGLHLLAKTDGVSGQIFNIGNPNEKKIIDLAHLIIKLTKTGSGCQFKPMEEDDPKKRKPDISKAKKILGWRPIISLEEGLIKTIEYFRKRLI